jgi:large exoprotein involved in heme utilization and adhesion
VSVLANTLTMTGAVNPITNSNEGGTIFSDNSGAIKGKGIAIALSGNLHLDTGSRITTDASGSGEGGDLAILADAVALQDQNTKISSDTRSPTGSSGALEITANSILVENSASISATTLGAASTNALSINTGSLTLSSGSSIAGQTAGTGTSTTININASGSVLVTGSGSEISSSTFSFDGADAGKINITAGDVSVLDEGSIQSESSFFFFGAPGSVAVTTDRLVVSSLGTISTLNASAISAGGDVTIDAKSVLVTGTDPVTQRDSSITSSASSDAAGGNVVIRTDTIDVTAGGRVEALTQQDGAAGTISITGNLQVDGGFIDARTLGTGAGGSIVLAGDISVSNGGRIDTSTPEDNFGAGNAGQLSISGASLVVSGSGSAVASSTQSDGAAGSVAISSASVSVTNGGTITTSTTSVKPTAGDAGDISLASKSVSVSGAGSTIASSTAGPAVGGNIAISGTDLTIAGKGRVTVTATGAGNAGNISLIASNTLDVLDAGNVETNAALSGGGSINIDVVNRIYLRDSTITASSGGPEAGADGGNITIDPIFFILDNSNIVAQAVAGNGGIINLYADNFIRDINSTISASSQLGNDGEVTITSPDNAVAGVIGALATGLASEEVLLSEPCAARVLENRSSLVVVKASHGYAAPDDYLSVPTLNCQQ